VAARVGDFLLDQIAAINHRWWRHETESDDIIPLAKMAG